MVDRSTVCEQVLSAVPDPSIISVDVKMQARDDVRVLDRDLQFIAECDSADGKCLNIYYFLAERLAILMILVEIMVREDRIK